MQRLKPYLIFLNPPYAQSRIILAIGGLITLISFPTHGQFMSSYIPIQEGQEFRCGPTEDCPRYTPQQQHLCGCVPGVVPYTTIPYSVEPEE